MFDLNQSQFQEFLEKMSATAIANQAVLTCHARGVPLTIDNAIRFIGDHFDPNNPGFAGLIDHLYEAIVSIVGENTLPLSEVDSHLDRKTAH